MKLKMLMFLCLAIQITCFGQQRSMAQEKKPASWKEFVQFNQSTRTFGTFVTEGETKDLWEGIKAGQKYIGTQTYQLSADGKSIQSSHRMETENGEVISLGVGIQYWDAKTNAVLSSYSGFDHGKLFTGFSELISIDVDKKTMKWIYTENSQGKTTRYKQQATTVSANEKKQVNQKESGGEAWEETLRRLSFPKQLAPRRQILPKLFDR